MFLRIIGVCTQGLEKPSPLPFGAGPTGWDKTGFLLSKQAGESEKEIERIFKTVK